MIEITFADQNDQIVEANLDGTIFYVHLAWNESGQLFTIGLQTAEGDTLIDGVTLVAGFPLFYRLRQPFMPLGDLLLISDGNAELTRQSFVNKTAHLMYVSESDLIDFNVLQMYGRI